MQNDFIKLETQYFESVVFYLYSDMKTLIALLLILIYLNPAIPNLNKQKRDIDEYVKNYPAKLILMAKIPKKKELIRIRNGHWPEEVEYSYNILKDSAGKVIFIAQIPFSESGDWSITYSYYFNSTGEIFAFERFTGFFNSGCTDDAAHETITKYYDQKFNIASQAYKLTDSKKKPLHKLKCAFPYDFKEYRIYRNVGECLKSFNIKL